jgi:hypothetical protein
VSASRLWMSVLHFEPEHFIVLAVSNSNSNIDRKAIRGEPLLMPLRDNPNGTLAGFFSPLLCGQCHRVRGEHGLDNANETA